jgi:hypothetical protein
MAGTERDGKIRQFLDAQNPKKQVPTKITQLTEMWKGQRKDHIGSSLKKVTFLNYRRLSFKISFSP